MNGNPVKSIFKSFLLFLAKDSSKAASGSEIQISKRPASSPPDKDQGRRRRPTQRYAFDYV